MHPALALAPLALFPLDSPISIDGPVVDWAQVEVAYADPAGDGDGIDFRRVWLAHDDKFLFVRFETTTEIDLSEHNDVRIYLDTDADAGTGLAVAGIGAELEWRPGARSGLFRRAGAARSVFHDAIRFRGAPTVTAAEFEIAFGLDALPDGSSPLFDGTQVRIAIRDGGGDQVPNQAGGIGFSLESDEGPATPVISIERKRAGDLRLASFNVLNDGPWGVDADRFERLVKAAAPDIISFQEIRNHAAAETLGLVQSWFPDRSWFVAGHADCHTVSAHPIVESRPLDGNLAVLIDAGATIDDDLLLVNAHLPCCADDPGRQAEIDRIMSFIRDAKAGAGSLALSEGTPFVITGDLNLVGFSQQLRSLLTGDIVDEARFGPDFGPDWGGGELINGISRQTERPMGYTWRSDSETFWPGHLDYVIYSGSVLRRSHHYLIYTPEMSPEILAAHDLLAPDSLASDHLLVVADFRSNACAGDLNDSGRIDRADLLTLFRAWGACPDCAADLNGDGTVRFDDMRILWRQWGSCP